MPTVSVCMIVKNEAQYLQQCLDSVKSFADEIIIVDTGSTDATQQIALQYTDKLFNFTWVDDFSAARNFVVSKATKEWIFMIDADEFVTENPKTLLEQDTQNRDVLAFSVLQRNYTTNQHIPNFQLLVSDKEHIPKQLQVGFQFKGFSDRACIKLFRHLPSLQYKYLVHEQLEGFTDRQKQIVQTRFLVHHIGFDAGFGAAKKSYYLRLGEKQLQLYPDDHVVLYNLAMAYADNKQLGKAVELLYTIYRQDKEFVNIVRVLSDFLMQLGKITETQQLLKDHIRSLEAKLTAQQVKEDIAELSYLYYLLGIVHLRQQQLSEAQLCYGKSNSYSENADAYNGLALLAVAVRKYGLAYELLQKASQLNPYNINVRNNLAKLKQTVGV